MVWCLTKVYKMSKTHYDLNTKPIERSTMSISYKQLFPVFQFNSFLKLNVDNGGFPALQI